VARRPGVVARLTVVGERVGNGVGALFGIEKMSEKVIDEHEYSLGVGCGWAAAWGTMGDGRWAAANRRWATCGALFGIEKMLEKSK
jgi:hypothetical protein